MSGLSALRSTCCDSQIPVGPLHPVGVFQEFQKTKGGKRVSALGPKVTSNLERGGLVCLFAKAPCPETNQSADHLVFSDASGASCGRRTVQGIKVEGDVAHGLPPIASSRLINSRSFLTRSALRLLASFSAGAMASVVSHLPSWKNLKWVTVFVVGCGLVSVPPSSRHPAKPPHANPTATINPVQPFWYLAISTPSRVILTDKVTTGFRFVPFFD